MIKIEQTDGYVTFSSSLPAMNFARMMKSIYGADSVSMVKRNKVTVDVLHKAFLIIEIEEYAKTIHNSSVKRELKDLIKKLNVIKDKYKREMDVHNVLKTMVWRPLSHQKDIFKDYIEKCAESGLRGVLLRGDVGSGKTSMSLMLTKALNTKHTVIIVPNNTIFSVWVKTIAFVGAYKKTPTYWTTKSKKPFNGEEYIIANFESLHKVLDVFERLPIYSLIIDESHNITADSNLSFTIRELAERDKPKGIIMLSGTPIKMSFSELLPMLQILRINNSRSLSIGENVAAMSDANKLKVAQLAYKSMEIRVKFDNGKNLRKNDITINIKIKNEHRYYVETLRQEMKDYVEQRKIEDEPKIDDYTKEWKKYIALSPLPKSDIKMYYKCINFIRYRIGNRDSLPDDLGGLVSSIEDSIPVKGEEAKKFRSLCSLMKWPLLKYRGEALGRVLGKRRKELSLLLLDYIDLNKLISLEKEKVLIYSNYIDVAKKVEERANKHKGVRIYDGNAKDVNSILHNTDFKFISTSYKSLSTGVPLIMCATTIFIEKPFRNYIMEQAMGRTDRLGQRNNITFIDFVLDTKEPNIYNRNNDLMKMSYVSSGFIMGDEIDKDYAKDVLDREEISMFLEQEMINAEPEIDALPIIEHQKFTEHDSAEKSVETEEEIVPIDDYIVFCFKAINTLESRDLTIEELESISRDLDKSLYKRAVWLAKNEHPQRRQELRDGLLFILEARMEYVIDIYLKVVERGIAPLPDRIVYGPNSNALKDWEGSDFIGQLISAHTPGKDGISLMERRDNEIDALINMLRDGVNIENKYELLSLRVHLNSRGNYSPEQQVKFAEVYKPNHYKEKLVTVMKLCASKLIEVNFIGHYELVACMADVHKILNSFYEPNSVSIDELLGDYILITK